METSWDSASRTYRAVWIADCVDGSGRFPAGLISEMVVPSVNFPEGYRLHVDGGYAVQNAESGRELIVSNGGELVTVTVPRCPKTISIWMDSHVATTPGTVNS